MYNDLSLLFKVSIEPEEGCMQAGVLKKLSQNMQSPTANKVAALTIITDIDSLAQQINQEVEVLVKFEQFFQLSQRNIDVDVFVLLILKKLSNCLIHIQTLRKILNNYGVEVNDAFLDSFYQSVQIFQQECHDKQPSPREINQFLKKTGKELQHIQQQLDEAKTKKEMYKAVASTGLKQMRNSVSQYLIIIHKMLAEIECFHYQKTHLHAHVSQFV